MSKYYQYERVTTHRLDAGWPSLCVFLCSNGTTDRMYIRKQTKNIEHRTDIIHLVLLGL